MGSLEERPQLLLHVPYHRIASSITSEEHHRSIVQTMSDERGDMRVKKVTSVLATMYRNFDGVFSLSFAVSLLRRCMRQIGKVDEVDEVDGRVPLLPNCVSEIYGGRCGTS